LAKAHLTQSHIAKTFKNLAKQQPIRNIRIQAIVKASDINRNTFYYHFADKQDLIIWIFRSEFAKIMVKKFPGQNLVCDTEIKGEKYTDFPFYIDARSKAYDLELGPFWLALARYLKGQSAYYTQVLSLEEESNSLREYLYKIYFVQMQKDVRYELGGKEIPEKVVTFLAGYFAGAILGYLVNATRHIKPYIAENPVSGDGDLAPFLNISHDLIKYIGSKIG
jgi:AcrR family transcriptional regulator